MSDDSEGLVAETLRIGGARRVQNFSQRPSQFGEVHAVADVGEPVELVSRLQARAGSTVVVADEVVPGTRAGRSGNALWVPAVDQNEGSSTR